MGEQDDLTNRVDALEEQGRDMRAEITSAKTDAAAARTLAAGADRDVGETRAVLRAHTGALNALRETQIDHGRTLSEHSRILSEHSRVLAEHGRILSVHGDKLDQHGRMLHTVQAGVDHIIDLLTEPGRPPRA